jgi:UDP-3-O-[3-hydroxymyristoyl] glucosamine N-acyltransferase
MAENRFFENKGPFPLKEIIKIIGCNGDFSKDNNFEIRSFESLDNAGNYDITFLNSSKYHDLSVKTKAAACITSPNLSKYLPKQCIKLYVKNVLFAATQVARMFYSMLIWIIWMKFVQIR